MDSGEEPTVCHWALLLRKSRPLKTHFPDCGDRCAEYQEPICGPKRGACQVFPISRPCHSAMSFILRHAVEGIFIAITEKPTSSGLFPFGSVRNARGGQVTGILKSIPDIKNIGTGCLSRQLMTHCCMQITLILSTEFRYSETDY